MVDLTFEVSIGCAWLCPNCARQGQKCSNRNEHHQKRQWNCQWFIFVDGYENLYVWSGGL